MRRRERRRKHLLGDLKKKTGCGKLIEETLACTVWWTRFGRDLWTCRKADDRANEWMFEELKCLHLQGQIVRSAREESELFDLVDKVTTVLLTVGKLCTLMIQKTWKLSKLRHENHKPYRLRHTKPLTWSVFFATSNLNMELILGRTKFENADWTERG